MEERLREEMERIIRVKSPEKVLETIRGKALKPKVKIGFGKEGLLEIEDVIEITHPFINKYKNELLDIGNATKDLNSNKELRELLEQIIVLKDASDRNSLETLMHLLNELIDKVKNSLMDFVINKKILGDNSDLRPIMIPASSGRDEIINIYLVNENYNEEDRVTLARKLLSSISVGQNISIFFEGDFHDYLKSLLRRKLDKTMLSSEDINSSRWELSQPYVTLARLLVWLRNQLWEDILRDNAVELMKASSGIIYFGSSVQIFPQLNRFVEIWLEKERNKTILESMLDSIKKFSDNSHRIGKKAVEGEIELLYDKLNFLMMRLIEGSLEWESLRRILDSMLDIAERLRKQGNDVRFSLHFISQLLEADTRGSSGHTPQGGRAL
jgi:hypothetical protein